MSPTTARTVFRDRALERRFRRDGYVVVPFAPAEEIAGLLSVHEGLDSGLGHGYYASMHSVDLGYKQRVHEEITSRFWPRLEALLDGHELLVGAFMVKVPGEDSWVPPHQDWIVTDEDTGAGINCWFPVTPVTVEVGRMSVLRGSHRYVAGLRGSPAFPTEVGDICTDIASELLEPIDVAVGEAIIYDNRLLHGTPPNLSSATRVVAYMSAIPEGARRVHYYIDDDGTVEGYQVGPDFFTSFNIGEKPEGERFVSIPGYTVEPLTLEQLRERHERANRWARRLVGR